MQKYHNIDGSNGVDVELLVPGSGSSGINSIAVVNTHAANSATVSIFIQTSPSSAASNTFYVIKGVSVPAGTTLLLDNNSLLSFNNRTSTGYGLYTTVGSSDTVDILIS